MTDPTHLGTTLLVEDNPGDVRLTKELFEDGGLDATFCVVNDGDEALDFIYRRGEYEDGPRPDLVLLDLRLPRVGGEEVLAELEGSEVISDVPVIVLSGSPAEKSALESSLSEPDACITKPIDSAELVAALRSFDGYEYPSTIR